MIRTFPQWQEPITAIAFSPADAAQYHKARSVVADLARNVQWRESPDYSHETNPRNDRFGYRLVASAAQIFGLAKVPGYRLYCLDRADKVASAEWIEADDDEAAIEVAKQMMDGHDCELWTRKRMVTRIPRILKYPAP